MPKKITAKLKSIPPAIHIYCEGKKTEPIYLQKYIDRYHAGNRLFIIERTDKNTPIGLVNVAISAKCSGRFPAHDIYWVVYDRESRHKYPDSAHEKAATSAQSKGINIALSNVCFEIWLLLHFESCTAPYTCCADLLSNSNFRTHLASLGVNSYDKVDRNTFDLILDQGVANARANADAMNSATLATAPKGFTKPHLLNPYCEVHKLLQVFDNFEAK